MPFVAALALLTAPALTAPAADPAGDGSAAGTPAARVTAWIAELSAPSRARRVRAERALLDLGPAAAALLPEAGSAEAAALPAAAADALGRVRAGLSAVAPPPVAAARFAPAAPPTGSLADAPSLADALAALSAQTGNPLDASALPPAALAAPVPPEVFSSSSTSDAEGTLTFWQALGALAPGRFAPGDVRDGVLHLLPAPPSPPGGTPPAALVRGPVRLELGPAVVRPVFGAGREHGDRLLRVPARALVEPRLAPLRLRAAAGAVSAAMSPVRESPDSRGESADSPLTLAPFAPGAAVDLPVRGGAAAATFDFLLPPGPLPDAPLPETVTASGELRVTVLPGPARFTLPLTGEDDPGRTAPVRTAAGVAVRLRDAATTADGLTATVSAAYAGEPVESHETWRTAATAALLPPAGAAIGSVGPPRTTAESPTALAHRFRFPPVAGSLAGWRLRVALPAPPTAVPVRFEDVRVPIAGRGAAAGGANP